jgi:hypothetical protein
MATQELEGFDEFGLGPDASGLPLGGWIASGGGTLATEISIVTGLSPLGNAVQIAPAIASGNCTVELSKTLRQNFDRIIGGFQFSVAYPNNDGLMGCVLNDGTVAQCSIYFQPVTGAVYIAQGSAGSVLATSLGLVEDNTTHYLEFDITFGTGTLGSWNIWLDANRILTGTGATQQSANAYCNVWQYLGFIPSPTVVATGIFDNMYVFDDTTGENNSVLLTNPAVITQWPSGEFQAQFTNESTFATNWQAVGLNPPIGDPSSVDGAVGNEDLYSFPPLPDDVLAAYAVGVSGDCRLLSPSHTIDLRVSSNGTVSSGSLINQTPGTAYARLPSFFDTDPATGSGWTPGDVNVGFCGMTVVT